jgi:hypothetical protein
MSSATLLPLILAFSNQLAEECRLIRFNRSAMSRHTCVKRCLLHCAIPLQSLMHRIRRGLIPRDTPIELFTSFALATLMRFQNDLLSLFRALDNRVRRTPALASLVERTAKAVAYVEDRERVLILDSLCIEASPQ